MSSTKVAMIGATVLVLGVLGMVTAKFLTTPDVEYPEDTISSGGSENSGTPVATGGETNSATTVPPSDTIAQSPGGSGIPVTPVTNSQSTAASATGVVDATDSDRGRRMMAKMSGVAINRASFFQDARGELGKAVDTGVRAALESCKLTYRAGVIEPVMNIRLEVRVEDGKKKLWMYAELLEKDGEETVRVWERKGSVVAVKDQALKSGLLPPNVDRDISRFFRSLRGDFDDARRQFTS